jgi:hypothetical protein
MIAVDLVERRPTVDEYRQLISRQLISAVGWKSRDTQAISRTLASSLFRWLNRSEA